MSRRTMRRRREGRERKTMRSEEKTDTGKFPGMQFLPSCCFLKILDCIFLISSSWAWLLYRSDSEPTSIVALGECFLVFLKPLESCFGWPDFPWFCFMNSLPLMEYKSRALQVKYPRQIICLDTFHARMSASFMLVFTWIGNCSMKYLLLRISK